MADLHASCRPRDETHGPRLVGDAVLSRSASRPPCSRCSSGCRPPTTRRPSPVSALFAALLTKVGVYALIRVFTLVYDVDGTPIETLLLAAALFSMALGALGGLSRSTIRQVLGFGIIASVGYMILGLAIGTGAAILGALFYLFQDVLVKAALFLGAGAATRLTGSEQFKASGGIWRARPGFALLFLIPALSLAGVPPLSGFWGKLLLLLAALEDGRWGLAFAVLATGLLILFAMARIWSAVFWAAHPGGADAITARLPAAMLAPIVVLVALIVYAGIDAGPLIAAVEAMAAGLIDPQAYVAAVLGDVP